MSRENTDQIIAHVDLLRAVDRLLSQAEIVRAKREVLARLLSRPTEAPSADGADKGEMAHAR